MTLYTYLTEIKKLPELKASTIRTAYVFSCELTKEEKDLIKEYKNWKKKESK